MSDVLFENFETVPTRLAQRSSEIAYLVLYDRTNPRAEDRLGRLNWEDEPTTESESDEDDDSFEPVDEEESLFDAFDESEEGLPGETTMAGQAVRWLQRMALDNFLAPMRRFRVRVYGPKGHSELDSFHFVLRGPEPEPELPTPEWPVTPPLSFEAAAERMGVGALDHLGRAYARFVQMVLMTVNQLQQIGAATNNQLHRQLVDTRGQNDRLVAAFVELQGELLKAERQGLDAQKSQAQMQLGQQALRTLDDATRLYLMTHKGLPPELQGLVSAVTGNPQLMQVLSSPQVQQLLQDPQAQQQLAALLQMAAQQQAAQAAPAASTPDPTPSAG